MSDKVYEELIKTIKRTQPQKEKIQVGVMQSETSCKINDLILEKEDLKIAEHLKTGWLIEKETFVPPIKKGDLVLLYNKKEYYIILERLVEL